jgi:hypothetical protein
LCGSCDTVPDVKTGPDPIPASFHFGRGRYSTAHGTLGIKATAFSWTDLPPEVKKVKIRALTDRWRDTLV